MSRINLSNKLGKGLSKLIKKTNSQLISNMLTVGIISLLIKGIGFYKEILIAEKYGTSVLLDTFIIAVLVPSFIQSVFINSYGSVFIPNYLMEKKISNDTGTFQTTSFIITISIALLMMCITYFGIDYYLEYLFPGHTYEYYQLIKKQLWIILPSMIFWAISSLISGLLMSDNEFFHSSFNTMFIPITTIICLFAFNDQLQEITLAIGLLTGSIISSIYLIIIGFKKKLLRLGILNFRNQNIKVLIKQIPAKISSGAINGVNPMVDQYFSAQMAIGAIAALNYGYKIPMVIISLIGGPIGNAILPHFSNLATENRRKAYKELLRILKIGIVSMSIVSFILILLSKFIVIQVFERGEFTSKDTNLVYVIQQMYMIQLPFYIVGIVMNKYLISINKNNFLVISSLLSLSFNIILNYTLIDLIGIKGLALATSLVSFSNAAIIYLYIKRQERLESYV